MYLFLRSNGRTSGKGYTQSSVPAPSLPCRNTGWLDPTSNNLQGGCLNLPHLLQLENKNR